MSQQIIKLPFFKVKNGSFFYLNEYKYLPLKSMQLTDGLRDKMLFDEGIFIQKRPIKRLRKITEKMLVVEPHPDDFALSASGYTLNAISHGADVTVLNIFSKTSVAKFPWRNEVSISSEQYEQLRIEESVIAIEQYLGEKFESFRLPSPSFKGSIETYPKTYHQEELINSIIRQLVKKITKERIDTVLCPMAVQMHIDHSVTFDATIEAFRLLKQNFKLIIYEDMPYARNKMAYFSRLKQIKKQMNIEGFYIPTDKYLDIMADLIIIYRSQFDDVNRQQMLAIIKEDFRATSSGRKSGDKKIEFSQHYFKVKSLK